MRRFLKITAIVLGVLLLIALGVAWWAYRATQRPVVWYEERLDSQPQQAEAAGDQLEKRALALVSDVKRPTERWEAIFSEEEVNGWLAADLAEKHADALPAGVSEPRIMIEPGGGRLACRYEHPRISTVLNMETHIYLTDQPNVVAVRIRNVRAGALPLPMKQFFDEMTSAAERHRIRIIWTEQNGDPTALLTLPDVHDGVPGRLVLESLVLTEGRVYLAGRTVPLK